uniref:Laminin subunit gamma-1 n=1 Tax=Anthurium amnicola TaxID=1678845 RepID=A0A1D1Y7S5_9ARAE
MAGLLAWAADVVGGGHGADDVDEAPFPAVVFSPEQESHARELDQRAASLRRSIQDLRRRIPPADISQRLPHLHAHSLASTAALALQLNAHSTTRQQAQLREETLQEENTAHEKAILACEKKIREKLQEASLLQNKLKELDLIERELKTEMEKAQSTWEDNQSRVLVDDSKDREKINPNEKPSKNLLLEQLNEKKNELSTFEVMVQGLEDKWAAMQHDSLGQPSPAQREKTLERQLHSLIEQLTVKQAQAEGLISEIKVKEQELENLNMLRRRLDFGSMEENTARNRFGRSTRPETAHLEQTVGTHHGHLNNSRAENQQKLILLRSAFVLYILALHVLVFIKISF